jgi:hypothetical protein
MNIKQGFINLAKYISLVTIIYIVFSFIFVLINIHDDLYISPDLKKDFWHVRVKKPNQAIIAIISPTRPGELSQSIMIRETAEKMGHLVYGYSFNDKDMDLFLPAKYMNELLLYVLNYVFKPDLHLAMSFHVNIDLPEPKIMYISIPPAYFIDRVKDQYPMVVDYNSFLDINLLNSDEDWLSFMLNKKIKRYKAIVGIPANQYRSSNRKKLLLFGSLWGRNASAMYQAIKELARQDYMFFVRHKLLLLGLNEPQNFADDAEGLNALQIRLNQYGIGLCIHSKYHVAAGIPSNRIFEIISSGAIAISDKNPFVEKYFADNVLYFDQTKSAEEIYNQIDAHVKWVQQHPDQAEIMAQKAHKILQENFTTEHFIQDLMNKFSSIGY